jgi:hypothetical protein
VSDQSTSNDNEQGAWARPVSARLGEVSVALVLLATGLFFAWQSALLPFGHLGLPGPAFFPFVLGCALTGLAVAILHTSWRETSSRDIVHLGHRDVLIALLAMAGLALAFENADSYVVMGVFAAVLLVLIGRTSIWRAVLGATLGMVAAYLFFGVALGVRLPAGDFWQNGVDFVTGLLSSSSQQ